MAKYLVLYRAKMSAVEQLSQGSPEQAQAGMQAWMDWAQRAGHASWTSSPSGVVDPAGGTRATRSAATRSCRPTRPKRLAGARRTYPHTSLGGTIERWRCWRCPACDRAVALRGALDIDPDSPRRDPSTPATGDPGGNVSPLGCERTLVQIPQPDQDDRELLQRCSCRTDPTSRSSRCSAIRRVRERQHVLRLVRRDIGVPLTDPGDRARLAQAGRWSLGPAERPMGGYLALLVGWRNEPGNVTAREWVGLAYRQVGALAPKRPKSRKARQKS